VNAAICAVDCAEGLLGATAVIPTGVFLEGAAVIGGAGVWGRVASSGWAGGEDCDPTGLATTTGFAVGGLAAGGERFVGVVVRDVPGIVFASVEGPLIGAAEGTALAIGIRWRV
jgi:hypothetical protein